MSDLSLILAIFVWTATLVGGITALGYICYSRDWAAGYLRGRDDQRELTDTIKVRNA